MSEFTCSNSSLLNDTSHTASNTDKLQLQLTLKPANKMLL